MPRCKTFVVTIRQTFIIALLLGAAPVPVAYAEVAPPMDMRSSKASSIEAYASGFQDRGRPQDTTVQDRVIAAEPSAVTNNDETEDGRCRIVSRRNLFGRTVTHRKCDAERVDPVEEEGRAIDDGRAAEPSAAAARADAAAGDSGEGRCRVVSRRNLFGAVVSHEKCD